jgi:hypothetical protein
MPVPNQRGSIIIAAAEVEVPHMSQNHVGVIFERQYSREIKK